MSALQELCRRAIQTLQSSRDQVSELVHTRADCPIVGTFSCSSDLQNRAHRLIDWSIRSNMSYVATDCPHREKNGWQEENWHMARAISYGYDVQSWYNKIARDIRDTQLPDGHIPTNCPNYLVGIPPHGYWNEAPEWGSQACSSPGTCTNGTATGGHSIRAMRA